MADEHDAPALGRHRPERREELVRFLRREDRGGLVHDQDPGAAVEHLQDLDPLLLTYGQLPDPGAWIHLQAEPLRELPDLRLGRTFVEQEARPIQTQEHVLGDGLRRHEREVLMDHPQPGRDRVARRAEGHRLAVHEDLAAVRPIQPGQHVHQGALAGAVLAQEGVDLAGAQVEIDVVVREHARKLFDDAAGLDGQRRRLRPRRGGARGVGEGHRSGPETARPAGDRPRASDPMPSSASGVER